MLVLTRKTQQQIQIGPHIKITILQVKGESVRVGIEAPRDMNVFRTELVEKLGGPEAALTVRIGKAQKNNRASAQPKTAEVSSQFNPRKEPLRCRVPGTERAPMSNVLECPGPAATASSEPPIESPRRRLLMS